MANLQPQPYYAIRTRRPAEASSSSSVDSTYGFGVGDAPTATHDTSRVSYHVKELDTFAKSLEESATRAFPNRGRCSQRYKNVQALLLHWKTDDLFVLPELEDLEASFREDYGFNTDVFAIPADNPHLELMMRIGSLVKEHESEGTLFIVYYGGHAKIDESRQSTWCATRHSGSPSLQWSAIQTLLERSISDVLVLLDCCAGAASATFPNGKSITETISASSWDAIAPDPGRYSFTNALIEVLGEWRHKTFSAAMLHAEVLARLKHPRPILINGKRFEARSTPVHFMMTSDHRAPSIEMSRLLLQERIPPSPPQDPIRPDDVPFGRGPIPGESCEDPNEDTPHVMISLALEDNQRLDLNAWEQWLSSFPALAKHVRVQGVFKSHSTLLLLSLPVQVWDLLPEDPACSFVAFIRSNNLIRRPEDSKPEVEDPEDTAEMVQSDRASIFSGTTFRDSIMSPSLYNHAQQRMRSHQVRAIDGAATMTVHSGVPSNQQRMAQTLSARTSLSNLSRPPLKQPHSSMASFSNPSLSSVAPSGAATLDGIIRQPLINQSRNSKRTVFGNNQDIPESPRLAAHVVSRLEQYYGQDPNPNDGLTEYFASHLGIEASDVKVWFHHRRLQEKAKKNPDSPQLSENVPQAQDGPQMILAGQLSVLLDILLPAQILFVDLRPPSEFQKSHVHSAVNLRIPSRYLSMATPDMLDRTFPDDQSRRSFTRWNKAKCIVIYDRNIEASWECPAAPELLDMLRNEGWNGKCFMLKGPFREFAMSYDKYITGDRMTEEGKRYIDGLRSATPPTESRLQQNLAQYEDWLRRVRLDHGTQKTSFSPSEVSKRKAAVDDTQRELEAEFKARLPDLHKRLKDLESSSTRLQLPVFSSPNHGKESQNEDDFHFDNRKTHLVGNLATGLDKMREASGSSTPAGYSFPKERENVPDKLGELPKYHHEDYDEIDKRETRQSPQLYGTGVGRGAASSTASMDTVGGSSSSQGPPERERRGGREGGQQKQGLWKRLKSTSGK